MPDECVFRLHKDLYPSRVISKAVAEFSPYSAVTVKRTGAYHLISLVCAEDVDIHVLKGEFLNYCLMLVKSVQ